MNFKKNILQPALILTGLSAANVNAAQNPKMPNISPTIGESAMEIIDTADANQETIAARTEEFSTLLQSIKNTSPRFFSDLSEEKALKYFENNAHRLVVSVVKGVMTGDGSPLYVRSDEVQAYGKLIWESLRAGAEDENVVNVIDFLEAKWNVIDFSKDGEINGAQQEKTGIAWVEMLKTLGLKKPVYQDVEGNDASAGFVPENVLLKYITAYIRAGGSIEDFEKREQEIASFIKYDLGEKKQGWWGKLSGKKNNYIEAAETINMYSLFAENGVKVNMNGNIQKSNKEFGVHFGANVVVDDRTTKYLGENNVSEGEGEHIANGFELLSSSFALTNSVNDDGKSRVELSHWSSDVEQQSAAIFFGSADVDELAVIGISVTAPEYNTEDWVMTYETIDGKTYAILHNNAVEQNVTILVSGEGEIIVLKREGGKVVEKKYKKPVKNKENKYVLKLEQKVVHTLDSSEEGNKMENFLNALGVKNILDTASITAIHGESSGATVRAEQSVGTQITPDIEMGVAGHVDSHSETGAALYAKMNVLGMPLQVRAEDTGDVDARLNIVNTEYVKVALSARNGFNMNLSPVALEKWEKTEEKLVNAIMAKANKKDFQIFAYETLGAGKNATTEEELQKAIVEAATVYVLTTQLEEIANDFSVQFNIGIDSIYNNLIGVVTPTLTRHSATWNAVPSQKITRVLRDMQYVGEDFSVFEKIKNLPDVPKENISFSAESVVSGIDVSGIIDTKGNVHIPKNLRLVEVRSLYNERNGTVDATIVVQPLAAEYDKANIESNTTANDRKLLETLMQNLLTNTDAKKEIMHMDKHATNERAWNAVNAAHAKKEISDEAFLFLLEQHDKTGGDILSALSDIVFVEMDNRHTDATDVQVIERILTKERANPDHILPTLQTANELFGIPKEAIINALQTMNGNISSENLQTKPYTLPSDMQLLVHGLGNKANLLEMSKGQTVTAIGAPIHFEHNDQDYMILFNKGCNGNFIIGREKPEPIVQEKKGIVASPTVERAIGSLSLSAEFASQGPWREYRVPVEIEPGRIETVTIRFQIPQNIIEHHAEGIMTTGRPSTASEALQILQYRPNDPYLRQAIDSAIIDGVPGADHTLDPSEKDENGNFLYPNVYEYTQQYLTEMYEKGLIHLELNDNSTFWSADDIANNTANAQTQSEANAITHINEALENIKNPTDIIPVLENAGYTNVSVEIDIQED